MGLNLICVHYIRLNHLIYQVSIGKKNEIIQANSNIAVDTPKDP